MWTIRTIFKEPLVHFLIAGCVFFLLFDAIGGKQASNEAAREPQAIAVDEASLVLYVKKRYGLFAPDAAPDFIAGLSPAELHGVVDDYVTEEAFYREALSRRLGDDDFTVRQRLVTQLELLNRKTIADGMDWTDTALHDYYAANRSRYVEPAFASFTHVFLRRDEENTAALLARAEYALQQLNAGAIDSNHIGDPCPMGRHFVSATTDEVASAFGRSGMDALFAFPVAERWQGPIESRDGVHLVLMKSKTPLRVPPFDEVRSQLVEDATAQRLREQEAAMNAAIVARHKVTLAPALSARLGH